jgi:hypothetical protein
MAAVGVGTYLAVGATIAAAGVGVYEAQQAKKDVPQLPTLPAPSVPQVNAANTQTELNAQAQQQQMAAGSLSNPQSRNIDTAPNAPRKSLLGS